MIINTSIDHNLRIKHNITCDEYVLLDLVFKLGKLKNGPIDYKKIQLNDFLQVSKDKLKKIIENLVNKGLIIVSEKYLIATTKIYDHSLIGVIINPIEKAHEKRPNIKSKIDYYSEVILLFINNFFTFKNSDIELKKDLIISFSLFDSMRNLKKKPMTDNAKKSLIKKLYTLSQGDLIIASDILMQSEFKSWTDIYELKQYDKLKAKSDERYIEERKKLDGFNWIGN